MTTLKEQQLFESFHDKEYRDTFVEEHINVGLAYQIRSLREKFGWTQEELARRTGKAQETISQLENPDYGSYTLRTLKTLASAFDLALQVNFISFKDLVRRAVNLTPEIIAPRSYDEELQMASGEFHTTDVGTSHHRWTFKFADLFLDEDPDHELNARLHSGKAPKPNPKAPNFGSVDAVTYDEEYTNAAA